MASLDALTWGSSITPYTLESGTIVSKTLFRGPL
jgi:hypothetical protein